MTRSWRLEVLCARFRVRKRRFALCLTRPLLGAMLQFGFLAAVFWWVLIAFNMCLEVCRVNYLCFIALISS